jgi:hypothetical protein
VPHEVHNSCSASGSACCGRVRLLPRRTCGFTNEHTSSTCRTTGTAEIMLLHKHPLQLLITRTRHEQLLGNDQAKD